MDANTPTPAYLDAREIAYSCAEAGLGQPATQALCDLARRIAASPALQHVVSAAHQQVFHTRDNLSDMLRQLDAALGDDADLLHALFLVDSIRLVRERHALRGVPPEVSLAVSRRHSIAWLLDAEAQGGQIGVANWMPGWLRIVTSGHMYRLGRLEFVMEQWDFPARVYTHVRTQAIVVLAEAGQHFTADGYMTGELTWDSTLLEDDAAITGTPITPLGVALAQPVRLPRDEWQLTLGQGDWVLDMHIPTEGVLTLDALRDALMQAESFFDRYYPEQKWVAFTCNSWLFSPQLEALVGTDSNIVRWQREGYLLPNDGGNYDFLTFTFGAPAINIATAPRDTRLRRAVIAHLERGELLRCGSYILLRRDLGRFGSQPYRQAG